MNSITIRMALVSLVASNAVFAGSVSFGSVVVAGSTLESPPPFMQDSFWGINSSIDRAFPFNTQPSGPYLVDELEVAVYHSAGLAGSAADFWIHSDDAGVPGDQIASFDVLGITMTQTVLTSTLSEPVLLESDQRYWIIGSTGSGQVNWSLSDFALGEAAFRVDDGDWEFLPNANVSAFALLGTPVPEPTTLALTCLVVLASCNRRRVAQ